MNSIKYILRGFVFYRKKHVALMLAVALSTMVLTGALLIGDSVKNSLRNMVEQRLGKVGFALRPADRMLTEGLVDSLNENLGLRVVGIIETKGVAINPDMDLRLPQTQVYGVDNDFWDMANFTEGEISNNGAYLSLNLANRISADSGDFILLRIKVPQVIAINTPFSQEEEASIAVRVQVRGIMTDDNFGRFSLKSDQKLPFNVFVNKAYLAKKLDMQGLVNQILVEDDSEQTVEDINQVLSQYWTLSDIGIALKTLNQEQTLLSATQVFISQAIVEAIATYPSKQQQVFTYLVNEINLADNSTPYSFVSGVEKSQSNFLKANEIIINEWLAKDLNAKIGDSIHLKYFAFGIFRNLEEKQHTFIVKSIEPNQGLVFNKQLMPDFPGLSEAGSCSEWNTGVPIDLDKIRKTDEDYWDEYKGTPKAVINLKTAQKLWENEYGSATGIIISQDSSHIDKLTNHILANLAPKSVGLDFQAVKLAGATAASSGVDFGELFLSLSFFVIVAAIILMVVIYVLNLMARREEWSTLRAVGLHNKTIRKLVFLESTIPLFLGTILGALLGVYYNQWLITALNTIWHDAVYTNTLFPYLNYTKVLYGLLGGIFIGIVCIYWVLNRQLKESIVGVQTKQVFKSTNKRVVIIRRLIAIVISLLTIAGIIWQYDNPSISLSLGFVMLILGIWWFSIVLSFRSKQQSSSFDVRTLVLKNLSQAKSRSVLIVLLLAIGIFTVIVTGANRKTFSGSENHRTSGTGGFTFWAESTLPILYDMNSANGKEKMGMGDESLMDSLDFISMNLLPGDDASCLNLNLVEQPAILGLDVEQLNDYQSFSFAKLLLLVDIDNPWLFLNDTLNSGLIPIYLDQTVIQWGLMKKVGDTLSVLNENGEEISLLIAGGLNASVFQGHILMGQKYFMENFPSRGGAQVFLIDAKNVDTSEAQSLLQFYLKDFGIEIQNTEQRLTQFNAVTNTYLNIFMLLGGLSVIIGTLGFGVVIYRSLLERKKELAVLMALGFRKSKLRFMLMAEYGVLLCAGIGVGLVAAIVGMLPTFFSESFTMPLGYIVSLMTIITVNGLFWIFVSVVLAMKAPLLDALKAE